MLVVVPIDHGRRPASAPTPLPPPAAAQVIHFMRHGVTEMNMYLAFHDHEDEDFVDPLL